MLMTILIQACNVKITSHRRSENPRRASLRSTQQTKSIFSTNAQRTSVAHVPDFLEPRECVHRALVASKPNWLWRIGPVPSFWLAHCRFRWGCGRMAPFNVPVASENGAGIVSPFSPGSPHLLHSVHMHRDCALAG
jgi:hypothetical protein